jgi:predicted MFS family arabinose efflux permease
MTNRWTALAVIFVAFLQFTMNWFAVIPALPHIAGEVGLSPVQLGSLVGAFVAGYGIAHVPAGMFAERFGLRAGLIAGAIVETGGAVLTAAGHDYGMLFLSRIVCGVGGSLFIGSAVGLTTAWFRNQELALANGLITGVAFSVGAAIGLWGLGTAIESVGWRTALSIGAAIGGATVLLLAIAFPTPPLDDVGHGANHSWASLRRVLGNVGLWRMSFAFLGGYGAYFTAVAMLPGYAVAQLHVGPVEAERIAALLLLSGIIGSFIGGWLSDKLIGIHFTFLIACILEAIALLAIPSLGATTLPIAAALIGAAAIFAFVPWVSLPGTMRASLQAADIPTAVGLMLSVVAIGGALFPPLYARLSTASPTSGWTVLGLATMGFAILGIPGRRLARATDRE